MRILVIAATKLEIEPFLDGQTGTEVLITGVGVPATMYHLQKALHHQKADLVIQAGIAGTFTENIPLGRVALVKQDTFADIGMEEKQHFKTIFQAGFADKDLFPFTDGWLVNPHAVFSNSLLPAVTAITVNKVSDSVSQKQQAINHFSPHIESMEGAALHYVCLQEQTPFIQIRAVSNFIGERDKSKWKMQEAIINLNKELDQLVKLVQA